MQRGERRWYNDLWQEDHSKAAQWSFLSNTPNPYITTKIKELKRSGVQGPFLDLGCGNGRHTLAFAKEGFAATGVDYASNSILHARRIAKQQNVKAKFYVGDVLGKNISRYRIVLDFTLFTHLRKYEWQDYFFTLQTLSAESRYILVCFSTRSTFIPGFSPRGSRRWACFGDHYNRFFTKKEILGLFNKLFKVVSYETLSVPTGVKLHAFEMIRK